MTRRGNLRLIVAVLFIAVGLWRLYEAQSPDGAATPAVRDTDNAAIAMAYERGQSDLWVDGSGRIVRILEDDLEGSRHQRFIVEVSDDQTVLIAHNIDLAPRIPGLERGDRVGFHGEYEWNEKGGVVHWTHHDPRRRHPGGWLDHDGRRYE